MTLNPIWIILAATKRTASSFSPILRGKYWIPVEASCTVPHQLKAMQIIGPADLARLRCCLRKVDGQSQNLTAVDTLHAPYKHDQLHHTPFSRRISPFLRACNLRLHTWFEGLATHPSPPELPCRSMLQCWILNCIILGQWPT